MKEWHESIFYYCRINNMNCIKSRDETSQFTSPRDEIKIIKVSSRAVREMLITGPEPIGRKREGVPTRD